MMARALIHMPPRVVGARRGARHAAAFSEDAEFLCPTPSSPTFSPLAVRRRVIPFLAAAVAARRYRHFTATTDFIDARHRASSLSRRRRQLADTQHDRLLRDTSCADAVAFIAAISTCHGFPHCVLRARFLFSALPRLMR